eukprot:scaffold14604_cov115-Isochrysis_galbana.AAC.3
MSPRNKQRNVKEGVLVEKADNFEADQVRSKDGNRLHHGQVVGLVGHEVTVSLARSRVVVRVYMPVEHAALVAETVKRVKAEV